MLDVESWIRLVRGLRNATVHGNLDWQLKSVRAGEGAKAISYLLLDSINQPKVFVAVAQNARYELSSETSLGRAPYELTVWEMSGPRLKPIDSIRSSVSVGDPAMFALNMALEELFRVLDATVESSSAIVDRLLGELGEVGD